MPEELLQEVRGYLHITWEDEQTDKNLIGYIKRGMARLQHIAGVPLDFTQEDSAKTLLLDYCRYANSNALEVFETNFSSELIDLYIQGQLIDSEVTG